MVGELAAATSPDGAGEKLAVPSGSEIYAPDKRDRHYLYQVSVQSPEADVRFFDRVFKRRNGKLPSLLREDFCGTAFVSSYWVKKRSSNQAIGIDLDKPTLDWGMKYNVLPLGKKADRLTLYCKDVRTVRRPRADVIAAMNFSYFVFKQRNELRDYFRIVRSSLAPGGILVLDIFGGSNSQEEITERRKVKGFTYIWEQVKFDPITHETLFHIHFKFPGGGKIRRAFTYDWRLWSIPEVREILIEAGFSSADVYWEGTDRETGEGNGVYYLSKSAESCPGWIAYIVGTTD